MVTDRIAVNLDVKADISVYIAKIVVLINVCIAAIVKVGVVLDLSDKDKIHAIAVVVAQIIVDISACISVFLDILVNVTACVSLDAAIKLLLINLNLNVSGIISIIASRTSCVARMRNTNLLTICSLR